MKQANALKIAPQREVNLFLTDENEIIHKVTANWSANGEIVLNEDITDGIYYIFIQIDGHRFSLGQKEIKNTSLNHVEDLALDSALEKSAKDRFTKFLQIPSKNELTFSYKGEVFTAEVMDTSAYDAVEFFMLKIPEEISMILSGESLDFSLNLFGSNFHFNSIALEFEKSSQSLAVKYPSSVIRSLKRRVSRLKNEKFSIELSNESFDVIDISSLGARISVKGSNAINVGDHFTAKVKCGEKELFETSMLVISEAGIMRSLSFAHDKCMQKQAVYKLYSEVMEEFEFGENNQDAWKCLDDFGYLGLLEGDILKKSKQNFIDALSDIESNDKILHPVAYRNGIPKGTIGAVKIRSNQWMPLNLSSSTDINDLFATKFMYLSWPTIMLTENMPNRFTTWYDSNMKWHNRFYQVFAEENKNSKHLVVADKHWFVAQNFKDNEVNQSIEISSDSTSEQLEIRLKEQWVERYNRQILSPAFDLEISIFNDIRDSFYYINYQNKSVGILKSITSNNGVSPTGIINCFHINIFQNELRQDREFLTEVTKHVGQLALNLGLEKAAFTFCVDLNKDYIEQEWMHYLGMGRCLSADNSLLPSLLSNNILSFENIKLRKLNGKM